MVIRLQAKAVHSPGILLTLLACLFVLASITMARLVTTASRSSPTRIGNAAPPHAGAAAAEPGSSTPNGAAATDVVQIHVEHTLFHPMDNVVLNVERMNGRMIGKPGSLISLDDRNSFSVHLDEAVTRLSAQDLSALINSYLLKRAGSAIRHVDVSFDGQQVVVKGKVRKLLTLPFQGRGTISATPDGDLRMHMDEFRVAGVLNRNFLAFLGIRLDDVAQPRHKASFRVEGDDFITALDELFPPPLVYGKLTGVHVEKQDLVQVIGVEPPRHAIQSIPRVLPEPPNYIYFSGGRMHFGRMTMDNVDLKMIDETPGNAFDFSLDHYQEQIQAGYVKVLPSFGLEVYAVDWRTLSAREHK
jgi:hypothetical protein